MRRQLDPAALDLAARGEVLDAEVVEVQTLERQQREEQPALLAGDERAQAAGARGIRLEERDRVELDVGVATDAVRVRVVARVLRVPPVVAHSRDAAREDPAEAVVCGARLEDLAVGGLVRQEGDLGQHDAERCGDEQLEPAVAEQDEAGHAARRRRAGSRRRRRRRSPSCAAAVRSHGRPAIPRCRRGPWGGRSRCPRRSAGRARAGTQEQWWR